MNISGIYKIQSIVKPERIYIGSTMNIYKRWERHLLLLRRNKHHSQKLQRHFNKYGKNDLVFSILIICNKEELINTEQYFIDIYQPYFNGRIKAFTNGGFKHTEEAKKKISEAFKGAKNPNYGKHFSKEHRRKISDAKKGISVNLGRRHTEEAKRKISLAKKGKPNPHKGNRPSDKGIERIKELLRGRIPWNKGKPYPHKGYVASEETLKKRRESMLGKTHSEESKKKMSDARKKYYELKRLNKFEFSVN